MTARYIRVESCGGCQSRGAYICIIKAKRIRVDAYRKPGQFPSWCPLDTEPSHD